MNDFLSNTSIRRLIPCVMLAGLLWLSFLVLREFFLVLAWALIIVYVKWQPYRYLQYKLNNKATLSAAVMTTVIAAVVLLTVYWLVIMLQDELKTAYQSIVVNLSQDKYWLPDYIKRIPWLGSTLQIWLDRLSEDLAGVVEQFASLAQQWSGKVANFLRSIGSYIMKLGVILVTVFFVFVTVTKPLDNCTKVWFGF